MIFQCPRCDTPISEGECTCGFSYGEPTKRSLEDHRRSTGSDLPVTSARRAEEGKLDEQFVLPFTPTV